MAKPRAGSVEVDGGGGGGGGSPEDAKRSPWAEGYAKRSPLSAEVHAAEQLPPPLIVAAAGVASVNLNNAAWGR